MENTLQGASGQAIEDRQEKHIDLFHAVTDLGSVTDRLCDLIDRIKGSDSPKGEDPSTKPNYPSLLESLDETPAILRERTSTMHSLLNDLERLIF